MTEGDIARVGGLLLAAGGSTRFGSPKQLAEHKGKTLIRRAAEAIGGAGCSAVVVVLGSCVEECSAEVRDLDLSIVINDHWQTGMSSSIKAGLAKLLKLDPEIDGVLITLLDQPLVTAEHLAGFIERFRADRPNVIAAEYDGTTGVPALFSRDLFDELFKLEGELGARSMIRGHKDPLTISLEEASTDVDNRLEIQRLDDHK